MVPGASGSPGLTGHMIKKVEKAVHELCEKQKNNCREERRWGRYRVSAASPLSGTAR